MDEAEAARRLIADYPKVFFACHARHRRDPATREPLSSHQGSILDHLDEVEPTGLTELAEHMGVTPSTMSLNVTRLERRGYLERRRSRRDARRVQLVLTPAGVRVKGAQSVLEPERVRSLVARLGAADRAAALHGLALLAAAAQEEMRQQSRRGQWWKRSARPARRGAEAHGKEPS